MRVAYVLLCALLFWTPLQAQNKEKLDKQVSPNPKTPADTVAIQKRIEVHSEAGINTKWRSVRDSVFYTKYNKYGDLKDDDPEYFQKKPWLLVGLGITGFNFAIVAADRYVLKYDYAKVGFQSWNHNFKTGWEWDIDRFGMNFFFHPYSGAGSFNLARSNGYSFYQSIPFPIMGSLIYEYFGETTLPSKNDIINTPVSGVFLGEVLYRLSSNILDDRTTGKRRFLRELAAAAVDPSRGFSRLTTGKVFRHTEKEIYQKEPLNAVISTGLRKANQGSDFGTGPLSATFNLHLDYGNPFEIRSRKPFDYFKLRTDLNVGVGRKVLNNITGLGVLYGKNVQYGSLEMLVGVFQHYDYWDTRTFELGAIMFGGGVVSKLPLVMNSNLYTNLHLGIVPFAGNSTRYGPVTSEVRDYDYGGGLGGKLESTMELGRWASATFVGYYYWIHTYIGHRGDHYMAIIRPRIEVRFINNLSLGFEHLVFYSDRYPSDFHAIHFVRTEQRIFLKVFFEQFKRKD